MVLLESQSLSFTLKSSFVPRGAGGHLAGVFVSGSVPVNDSLLDSLLLFMGSSSNCGMKDVGQEIKGKTQASFL